MLLQNYVDIRVRNFASVKSKFSYWVPDVQKLVSVFCLLFYFAVKPVGVISGVPKKKYFCYLSSFFF